MQENESFLDTIRKTHPADAKLFGTMGAVAAEICAQVATHCVGKRYAFMDLDRYQKIQDPDEMNRIYWTEILYRAYWAAWLNLMRHKHWQAGCVAASNAPANFLSFVANLRGLIESALDANYSLRSVPPTLAHLRTQVEAALSGTLKVGVLCKELEDLLIHYMYARKARGAEKQADLPSSHLALEPWEYRNVIKPEEEKKHFDDLYNELCGYCHPTAFSVGWLSEQAPEGEVHLKGL